jgi:hypothetical protein
VFGARLVAVSDLDADDEAAFGSHDDWALREASVEGCSSERWGDIYGEVQTDPPKTVKSDDNGRAQEPPWTRVLYGRHVCGPDERNSPLLCLLGDNEVVRFGELVVTGDWLCLWGRKGFVR